MKNLTLVRCGWPELLEGELAHKQAEQARHRRRSLFISQRLFFLIHQQAEIVFYVYRQREIESLEEARKDRMIQMGMLAFTAVI